MFSAPAIGCIWMVFKNCPRTVQTEKTRQPQGPTGFPRYILFKGMRVKCRTGKVLVPGVYFMRGEIVDMLFNYLALSIKDKYV